MTTDELTPDVLVARVQELEERLDAIADPVAREVAEGLVAAVMDLYGEGLERILRALDEAGPPAAELRGRIVDDGVVGSLLLIHGLYPVDLETRVQEALDGVRPYMHSHGGDVELLGLEDGVARLRLEGSCQGCPASSATLEQAIRQALEEAAPDLQGLEVEGIQAAVRAPMGT
jgi:Fe-S cluster biogenesis protein NfuA